MLKKIISVILILTMTLSLFETVTVAANDSIEKSNISEQKVSEELLKVMDIMIEIPGNLIEENDKVLFNKDEENYIHGKVKSVDGIYSVLEVENNENGFSYSEVYFPTFSDGRYQVGDNVEFVYDTLRIDENGKVYLENGIHGMYAYN